MGFAIQFLPGLLTSGEASASPAREGFIQLGACEEHFISDLSFWAAAAYEHHWHCGIARAVEQHRESCLVTAAYDPAQAEMLSWWLLYPTQNDIVFREAILLFDQLSRPFDFGDLYSFIPERGPVRTDSGERISEWTVPLPEVRDALNFAP